MLGKIFILVIIIFVKAIFSAGDTAFTYVNKAKISHMSKTNQKAKKIKKLIQNSTKFYGIIEVVITMCELIASAYAAEAFVTPLTLALGNMGLDANVATVLSILIVTIVLSYFLLIFGGILPKRIARSRPERTAFAVVNVLWFIAILNKPFEKLIHFSTNLFSKLFHIPSEVQEKLTEKEIKMIIREGKDQGVVDEIEKQILLKTFQFNDLSVKDIYIPKEQVDFLNIDSSVEQILANIKKYNYTRMPVFQGNKNHIIGLFNIKDVVIEYANKKEISLDIHQFLRPALFVSSKDKVSHVFQTMKAEKQSLAIVCDENKKTVGIVTLEDILELLVGKIIDEYDK